MMDLCRAITGFPFDRVVVIDTETTGLLPWDDEVLSVSITDIDGNSLFNSYIRPKRKREWDEAQAIHGITPQMVKNAPTLDQCAQEIRSLLSEDKIVVGYNVEFDSEALYYDGGISFPMHRFDVMREFSRVHGRIESEDGYQWVKLSECASYYGYHLDPHDSLADAKATAWAFKSLLSDPTYLSLCSKDLAARYGEISFGQTTSTKNSIIELIGTEFASMDSSGIIKMGAITRGQNKGKPRYECFLNDLCVGVCDINTMWTFRRAFLVDSETELPSSFRVKVHLVSNENIQRCVISLDIQDDIYNKLCELAKYAPESGLPGSFSIQPANIDIVPKSNHTPDTLRNKNELHNFRASVKANKKRSRVKARYILLLLLAAFLYLFVFIGLTSKDFELSVPWVLTELVFLIPAVVLTRFCIRKIQRDNKAKN